MTTIADRDGLIQNLDRVVRDTLAYFDGPGRVTRAHVDRWGARDILMHFIYFHEATAWGIQSAAAGGPPWTSSPRCSDPTCALPPAFGCLEAVLEDAHEPAEAGVVGRVEAQLSAPRRGHDGDGQLGIGAHEHQALAARQAAQRIELPR